MNENRKQHNNLNYGLVNAIGEPWEGFHAAMYDFLKGFSFFTGQYVILVECESGDYFSLRHACDVNYGAGSRVFCLLAVGGRPGDALIAEAFSLFITVESIGNEEVSTGFSCTDRRKLDINPTLFELLISKHVQSAVLHT